MVRPLNERLCDYAQQRLGTGDQFDADNSNIVQLFSLLKKDDKTKQMVYYQVSWPERFPAEFYSITCEVGYWDVRLAEGCHADDV